MSTILEKIAAIESEVNDRRDKFVATFYERNLKITKTNLLRNLFCK